MGAMDFPAAVFPPSAMLPDRTVAAEMAALRSALATGDLSPLDTGQQILAERILQASEKISSGAEIGRISELMTLARFGPASIGIALARACDDVPAEPVAEALFVARFLVEVVSASPGSPSLLPGDMLKQYRLNRNDISWPSAQPVFTDLLARASETIDRADGMAVHGGCSALRKILARHRMQTLYRIRRLHGCDPASPRARLTAVDNLMISLRLLLRLRGPA